MYAPLLTGCLDHSAEVLRSFLWGLIECIEWYPVQLQSYLLPLRVDWHAPAALHLELASQHQLVLGDTLLEAENLYMSHSKRTHSGDVF